MATVRKNKKKIIVPICIVLVIAIISGTAIGAARSNSGEPVSLNTITTGDIYETVSLTGSVTSGAKKEYKVNGVATVKEVFVKVGDKVKKDDVLATFDTAELDSQINSLNSSYNDLISSYNTAVKNQKSAKEKADSLAKDIKELEKQIKALENTKVTTAKATTIKKTTRPTTERTTLTTRAVDIPTIPVVPSTTEKPTTTQPNSESTTQPVSDTVKEMAENIKALNETISKITTDIETTRKLMEIIAQTVAGAVASGQINSTVIAQLVSENISSAIENGVVDSTNLLIESGIAVKMISAAVEAIDFQGMADSFVNSKSVSLTSAQLQLAATYAMYELYNVQAEATAVNAQKKAAEAAKDALDILKSQQAEMQNGWKAAFDGIITESNIVVGEQTTLLSSGITLENLDQMVVTVSLGEYDYHKVSVGMETTVTTAYGKYDGEVAAIAPTATGGSNSSILDNVGSMAGISGLSSLTESGAGVECTITVNEPDENIIAGFDAHVEINTGAYIGITVVPVESITLEKTGSYVYLYNEEEKTVTKTQIETGANSDSSYEVKSGLKPGDMIVATPSSDYKEETFKVKVENVK